MAVRWRLHQELLSIRSQVEEFRQRGKVPPLLETCQRRPGAEDWVRSCSTYTFIRPLSSAEYGSQSPSAENCACDSFLAVRSSRGASWKPYASHGSVRLTTKRWKCKLILIASSGKDSMSSPQVSPGECLERHRLFIEFKTANQLLMQVHEAEIEALLENDLAKFEALEPQLLNARKRRDLTAENLQHHMREHGC